MKRRKGLGLLLAAAMVVSLAERAAAGQALERQEETGFRYFG